MRYFTDWALPQLDILLPETFEPIEVWTTLDTGMQQAAAASIKSNVPGGAQGALVSLDRDGAMLAMVGGPDYVATNYNRATEAMRQPGSAWKLFVYLAALEAGYTPEDRVKDVPVTIDGWSPRNSGGSYAGEIDLRAAFAYSKNTVAAQLGNEVGFGTVASMAGGSGSPTPISTYPAMVLGSSEVRVLDMTRAFAEVSARGQQPRALRYRQGYHQRGRGAVPARAPGLDPAGARLRRRRHDRPAADRGQHRHRARGADRAASRGQDRDDHRRTRTAGSSASRAGSRPACGWGATMPSRWRACRAAPRPARAFAAFMRYAVRNRPVEQFNTELKLPEWQLEPDDEQMFGNPDDYYYIDEQATWSSRSGAAPNRGPDPRRSRWTGEQALPGPAAPPTRRPADDATQAASDDFLSRATGSNPATVPAPAPTQRAATAGPASNRRARARHSSPT